MVLGFAISTDRDGWIFWILVSVVDTGLRVESRLFWFVGGVWLLLLDIHLIDLFIA